MKAQPEADGTVRLNLTADEVLVLHEILAFAEWSDDLEVIEVRDPSEVEVLSRVQQALAPHIESLGSDTYGVAVEAAQARIRVK